MSDSPTISWKASLRAAYLKGRANVFVLHGAVSDFQWEPESGFVSLASAVALLLGRSRTFVVTVDGVGDAELSHADAPATVRAAFSWARPGTRDIAEVLQGGPTVVLPALGRLLDAPGHPCGVILSQAALLLGHGADLGTRTAVAKVRRWLDEPGIRQTNNVAVLIVDRLDQLSPQVRHHPRLHTIAVGKPSAAICVAALRGELGEHLAGVSDARLSLATHSHTLVDVAGLCSQLASVSAETVAQHFPHPPQVPIGDPVDVPSAPALESPDV